STIAKRLNVSTELLKKLNPELKRSSTPRSFAGTYYLRVPKNKYSYRLNDIETKAASFEKPESNKEVNRRTATVAPKVREISTPSTYKVRRGDTLISISRKFKTTPLALAQANGFKSWKTKVRIGQRIKLTDEGNQVAHVQAKATRKVASVKVTNRPIVYKVRAGDNLTDIAKLFDQKVSKIKKANNLKRGKILIGQKIVLPDTKKGIY